MEKTGKGWEGKPSKVTAPKLPSRSVPKRRVEPTSPASQPSALSIGPHYLSEEDVTAEHLGFILAREVEKKKGCCEAKFSRCRHTYTSLD